MKKQNAFTLIELLAVIVILAIIAVIATPLTINVINSSKEKSFINSVYGLIDGARLLSAEQLFDDGSNEVVVNFTDGTSDNANFKVSGDMPNSGTLHLNSDGKVELKVWSEELGKCAEKGVNEAEVRVTDTVKELCVIDNVTLPIITLNGDTNITIQEGEIFTDPGYTATYRGVDITSSVQVLGSVDTSVVDTYTLTYTVSYNGKDSVPVKRVIKVFKPKTFREVMEPLIGIEVNNNDPAGNLRYVGKKPNNYIYFNRDSNGKSELWRIIGIFHDETKGDQIKIVRSDYYNKSIQWDINGSNNWKTASLQLALNNVTDGYIKMIETNDPMSYSYIDLEYVWNIGGSSTSEQLTRSEYYIAERSETPAGAEGSEATWIGAIGLMYPSDYGYASSGDADICDQIVMFDWYYAVNTIGLEECALNTWLYDSRNNQWTFAPISNTPDYVRYVFAAGGVGSYKVSNNFAVRPVLYLKSDTKIIGGLGTSDQPYELGVVE